MLTQRLQQSHFLQYFINVGPQTFEFHYETHFSSLQSRQCQVFAGHVCSVVGINIILSSIVEERDCVVRVMTIH